MAQNWNHLTGAAPVVEPDGLSFDLTLDSPLRTDPFEVDFETAQRLMRIEKEFLSSIGDSAGFMSPENAILRLDELSRETP